MKNWMYPLLLSLLVLAACNDDEPAPNNQTTTEDPVDTFQVPVISTDFGEMAIWLYDETPIHRDNFLKLAGEGFFDGTTFHRVINNFMIQGGDPNSKDQNPNNDGQGGPGYTLEAEIQQELKHEFGTVAAARLSDRDNPERRSSGSQFYIVENANGTPHLDGAYTVFGKVISGMEVINTIADQPVDEDNGNRPITNITMAVTVEKHTAESLKEKYNFVP